MSINSLNLRYCIVDSNTLLSNNEITNTEICKRFYTNSLLKRGIRKESIVDLISNLEIMIEKRLNNNNPFSINEFGDKMKSNDISVRVALLSVGTELMKRNTLSLLEMTYYFCKSRLNFLLSLQLDKTVDKAILVLSPLYYKVMSKLIISTKLFNVDTDNGSIDIICSYNDSTLKTLVHSVELYCFKYFSLIVIPVPCLTGYYKINLN